MAPGEKEPVLEALRRILASRHFCNAPSACRFLRCVVETTLNGQGGEIKEYRIGVDVFDRGDEFDPKIDTIVRVEGTRLRKRLAEYYQNEGAYDPIRIEIPRGTYQPVFNPQPSPVPPPEPCPSPDPILRDIVPAPNTLVRQFMDWIRGQRLPLLPLLVAVAVIASGFFAWTHLRNKDAYCRWRTGVPCEKRIAVLPFHLIGGEPSTKALAEGLLYLVTSKLSEIERFQSALWVVPAPAVIESRVENTAQAARALGVNLIVQGSIEKSAARTRITVGLLDASQGGLRQVNSRTIDQSTAAISDSVLEAVVEMLDLRLLPEAKRILAAGASRMPSAQDYYIQGLGYLERGGAFADQAMMLFGEALQADRAFALAQAGLAAALSSKFIATGDKEWLEKGKRMLGKALENGSHLPQVRIQAGVFEKIAGQMKEAEREFQAALKLDPGNTDAMSELASLYENTNRPEDAEDLFRLATEKRPAYWKHHLDWGVFSFRRGRYAEAERRFLQATILAPDNTLALTNLSGIYLQTNQAQKAIPLLKRSLAIRRTASTHNNLGDAYYLEGNYLEMRKELEEAVKLAPTASLPLYNLAIAYWLTSDPSKARETHVRALEVTRLRYQQMPYAIVLRSLIALNLAYLDRRVDALKDIGEALKADPGNMAILSRAVVVYERCGERKLAIEAAARLRSDDPVAFLRLEQHPHLKAFRADPAFR